MATVPSKDVTYEEWRGVRGLVAAELITDTADTITYGDVFAIAGTAEISKEVEASSEAHYYDNIPAIVINSTGADTVTVQTSAIPLDVLGYITGQKYLDDKGALIEGERVSKYFALGYITENTSGEEMYVWRLKGSFAIPGQTNTTKNDGTDANGQELVYTGISTVHPFTANADDNGTARGAKSLVVNTAKKLADVSTFFDEVTTPDTLTEEPYSVTYNLIGCTSSNTDSTVTRNGSYTSTITANEGTTLRTATVTMGGVDISSSAVSAGRINIASVTGHLVITATARA